MRCCTEQQKQQTMGTGATAAPLWPLQALPHDRHLPCAARLPHLAVVHKQQAVGRQPQVVYHRRKALGGWLAQTLVCGMGWGG